MLMHLRHFHWTNFSQGSRNIFFTNTGISICIPSSKADHVLLLDSSSRSIFKSYFSVDMWLLTRTTRVKLVLNYWSNTSFTLWLDWKWQQIQTSEDQHNVILNPLYFWCIPSVVQSISIDQGNQKIVQEPFSFSIAPDPFLIILYGSWTF